MRRQKNDSPSNTELGDGRAVWLPESNGDGMRGGEEAVAGHDLWRAMMSRAGGGRRGRRSEAEAGR